MSITLRTTPRIAGVSAPASDLAGFVRRFCEAPVFGSDLTVAIMNWMLAVDMTETNDDLVVTSASISRPPPELHAPVFRGRGQEPGQAE